MRPSKRQELLENALKTFYRNGFHATGMDMLAEECGISKTSIYKHFRTKEELILAVLRLRDENFRFWFVRKLEEYSENPKDQLVAIFDILEEWFGESDFKSCMFIKAASEYPDADHMIHKQAAEHKRLLENYVASVASKAGLSKPDVVARRLMLLKEGAIVAAHFGHTENPAQDAKLAAMELLEAV